MGRVTLTLPRLGETMEEARVTDWLVAPGVAYHRGDVLLEVETDKTVVEVPALADGRLLAHLVAPGEMVALDQPIAEVEQEGTEQPHPSGDAPDMQAVLQAPVSPALVSVVRTDGLRASPKARAAARRAGLALASVQGTGRNGRITATDVMALSRNGTGIAWHPQGSGAHRVVLLHGLFDSHRGWRDLPQRLARLGYAVLAPDLPGHGDTIPAAADLDDAASQLATALAVAAPRGPVTLIGHSLGAAIAVRLAQRLGSRVDRLILIAPAGIGTRMNAGFLDGMMQAETTLALSQSLALLDAGPVGAAALADELDRLRARRAGLVPLRRSLEKGGMQQIDLRDDLARLSCEIRVVWGTADRILDWQAVADLPPQVAIHLVRGAGHLPHALAPDLVTRLMAGSPSGAERVAVP